MFSKIKTMWRGLKGSPAQEATPQELPPFGYEIVLKNGQTGQTIFQGFVFNYEWMANRSLLIAISDSDRLGKLMILLNGEETVFIRGLAEKGESFDKAIDPNHCHPTGLENYPFWY